jgi:hypothetical protein
MEEINMANERIPNDPYRSTPSDPYGQLDNSRPVFAGDEMRNPSRLDPDAARIDNELQPDPELAEGPATGGRVAMFAVAIALVLGAVFYGLNNTNINQASTAPAAAPATSTAQNNAQQPPPAPPGMRDVTPRNNSEPGVTTGAAPARPQNPPTSAPTGQDVNRSGNPPMNNDSANK